ncbi:MAG TPA: SDR family NAD(P)-dependent oxidoreductase, partial [Terriglobales bacterium]|nr:SDR family NAD(P)-dependent oxidoreductase [Terriglobales bacterium]
MLFSSAIAANAIRRFKSTCRSFSKRMATMTIMHEPHLVEESSLIVLAGRMHKENSMERGNGLQHKRVIVLGGSSGIGLEVAKQAASQGASVVIASSSAERVEKAVESVGGEAQGQAVDVSDERAVATFFSKLGTFDHLVFTAGDSLHLHDLAVTDLQQARHAFELRYWAALAAVKYGCPHIRKEGSIVLTTGIAGQRPLKGWVIAASVCGTIEALTRALAVELAPIRV